MLTMLLGIVLAGADPGPAVTVDVGTGERGFSGDGGPAARARLDGPFDVAFDRDGHLFLSDTGNHRIRRVDARTGVITTIAGSGRKGFAGDGGPATAADLDEPYGLTIDPAGNLYFADRLNRRVRRVDARTGVITTVAGDGSKATSGDGGPAVKAGLAEPNGVAFDRDGILLIADVAGHRLRAVDLASGTISTRAGTGRGARAGDGGPSAEAALFGARAVATGADGTVYVVERQGNSVRAIDPASGRIRTVAGTGAKGFAGDGGPPLQAKFDGPKEVDIDREGRLLVVDTENHRVRRVDLAAGTVATVAGNGSREDGDRGLGSSLDRPHGVAVGPDGSLWIGDTGHHRIVRVRPPAKD